MSYTITVNTNDGFVEIVYLPPTAIEDHMRSKTEAVNLCAQHQLRRILVDTSRIEAHQQLDKKSLFEFGHEETSGLAELEKNLYAAIVLPESKESQDQMYFLLNIMRQNGLKVEPFFSREEAVASLMQC